MMVLHRFMASAAAVLAFGAIVPSAGAVTLYDPAVGTLPAAQGWLTTGTPGFVASVVGGTARLDTSASNAVTAGSALVGLSALNTSDAGFELDFGLRIVSESHARVDRGGFSVIFTGTDPSRALELTFWNDRVFAYTPSFVHGAEALLDTGVATNYALTVAADRYTLRGNGAVLLAGSLVDYSAFGLPYDQAGLLFFGDDTTSAGSVSELGTVALVAAVPEPATFALTAVGLAALAWRARPKRR